jgi:tetratricopeptide (TPR) repeat protein
LSLITWSFLMEPLTPNSKNTESKPVPPTAIAAESVPVAAPSKVEDDMTEIDDYLRQSSKAEEYYNAAVEVSEKGDERQTLARLLRAARQAEKAQEWHLAALSLNAMAEIFSKRGPERNLESATRFYRRAIAAYEKCGHFDEATRLEYAVSSLRLWNASELGLSLRVQLEMFLYWATAGFGYRPLRVIGSSVVMILVFGLIYWQADGLTDDSEEPKPIRDFNSAAYFSGSTFLTLNYGDILPAEHVRWLTIVEGLCGLTMSSFFVVVLVNRLRH